MDSLPDFRYLTSAMISTENSKESSLSFDSAIPEAALFIGERNVKSDK